MDHRSIRNVLIAGVDRDEQAASTRTLLFNFNDQLPGAPLPADSAGRVFLLNMFNIPDLFNIPDSVLPITDGALVVVNCVAGVPHHAGTVLHRLSTTRIVPVVTLEDE